VPIKTVFLPTNSLVLAIAFEIYESSRYLIDCAEYSTFKEVILLGGATLLSI
jgi:hypothetical protein